jgi:hypothetical protein
MPQVCTICNHPDRKQIDLALVKRAGSRRSIAKQFQVHVSSLDRHAKEHIPKIVAEGARVEDVQHASRSRKLLTKILDEAEARLENADDKNWSGIARAALMAMDMSAKYDLELDRDGPVVVELAMDPEAGREAIEG